MTGHASTSRVRLKVEHSKTEWRGTAVQYLVGRNNRVRRLRLHVGHHNLLFILIPKDVRVRRDA